MPIFCRLIGLRLGVFVESCALVGIVLGAAGNFFVSSELVDSVDLRFFDRVGAMIKSSAFLEWLVG